MHVGGAEKSSESIAFNLSLTRMLQARDHAEILDSKQHRITRYLGRKS